MTAPTRCRRSARNLTWVKGAHNVKAGVYLEKMARNVSVYSTYNTAGSYYFGSDTASAVDTGYPFSNLLTGGFFALRRGQREADQSRAVHAGRLVPAGHLEGDAAADAGPGHAIPVAGPAPHRQDQTLGLFDKSAFDASKAGQPLFPALVNGAKASINPVTGAVYPYVRQGTFDPTSYTGLLSAA